MKKIKFAIIGAGSAGFGPGSIADVVAREEMKEFDVTVTLALPMTLIIAFRVHEPKKQFRH